MRRTLLPVVVLALTALVGVAIYARTSDSPPTPVVVWAVGDGANGSSQAKAVAAMIEADRPAAVLYLGDVYDKGTARDFAERFDTVYGNLKGIISPTPGNHDWPNHDRGYFPYWAGSRADAAPQYRFDLGGWQLISLNSEEPGDIDSPQGRWLNAALADTNGTCRIAFWHRPRFSAGEHGDEEEVAGLWNAVKGKAAIVLNGHEHDLQRLKPVDGTVELISGAGGAQRYPVRKDDPRLAFANDSVFGALRLELTPGKATFAFVAAGGKVLDNGEIGCEKGS